MTGEECTFCACLIDPVTKPRGVINSCDHVFCSVCIIRWGEQTNICPFCKRRFTRVYTTDATTGEVAEKKIRRRNLRLPDDEEETGEEENDGWEAGGEQLLGAPTPAGRTYECIVCKEATGVATMALCTNQTCTNAIHARCLGPEAVALDDAGETVVWTCPSCGGSASPQMSAPAAAPAAAAAAAATAAHPTAAGPPGAAPRRTGSTAHTGDDDDVPFADRFAAPAAAPARTRRPRTPSPTRPEPAPAVRRGPRSEAAAAPAPSPSPAPYLPEGPARFLGEVRPELYEIQRAEGLAELARRRQAREQAKALREKAKAAKSAPAAPSRTSAAAAPAPPAPSATGGRSQPQPQPQQQQPAALPSLEAVRRRAYQERFKELRDNIERRLQYEVRNGIIPRHGQRADAALAAAEEKRKRAVQDAMKEATAYAAEHMEAVRIEREQRARHAEARKAIEQAAALRKLQLLVRRLAEDDQRAQGINVRHATPAEVPRLPQLPPTGPPAGVPPACPPAVPDPSTAAAAPAPAPAKKKFTMRPRPPTQP